jgi:membrane-anchored protein YejM (alkaline phosphatase superfamily)
MERVDKQIGVIVDALDASGQGEDTVVILTSVSEIVAVAVAVSA